MFVFLSISTWLIKLSSAVTISPSLFSRFIYYLLTNCRFDSLYFVYFCINIDGVIAIFVFVLAYKVTIHHFEYLTTLHHTATTKLSIAPDRPTEHKYSVPVGPFASGQPHSAQSRTRARMRCIWASTRRDDAVLKTTEQPHISNNTNITKNVCTIYAGVMHAKWWKIALGRVFSISFVGVVVVVTVAVNDDEWNGNGDPYR